MFANAWSEAPKSNIPGSLIKERHKELKKEFSKKLGEVEKGKKKKLKFRSKVDKKGVIRVDFNQNLFVSNVLKDQIE